MSTSPTRTVLAGGAVLGAVVAAAVVARRHRDVDLVEESEDYEAENASMFLDDDGEDSDSDADDDLAGTSANPEELADDRHRALR
jgi:hypothetical protein